jgi:ArsR family transcriptional regulator
MSKYSTKKDSKVNKEDLCQEKCDHTETVKKVQEQMASTDQLFELADLFKAFGDSTRMRILNALLQSELCVCDLVDIIGMSQSAISHQLRVLRSAKIVKHRKEGKNVYYSLDDNHIRQLLKDGLEHVTE